MGLASLLLLAFYSVNTQRPIYPDLPSPRIVIMGMSGAGKNRYYHECILYVIDFINNNMAHSKIEDASLCQN